MIGQSYLKPKRFLSRTSLKVDVRFSLDWLVPIVDQNSDRIDIGWYKFYLLTDSYNTIKNMYTVEVLQNVTRFHSQTADCFDWFHHQSGASYLTKICWKMRSMMYVVYIAGSILHSKELTLSKMKIFSHNYIN